jgi:hypothetical protein
MFDGGGRCAVRAVYALRGSSTNIIETMRIYREKKFACKNQHALLAVLKS